MNKFHLLIPFLFVSLVDPNSQSLAQSTKAKPTAQPTEKVDREYALEASMLGYFSKDGARNPTLKANKGDRVRITITDTEQMTHDIALDKLGYKK